jgi:ribosomal protein L11 methyltransferase
VKKYYYELTIEADSNRELLSDFLVELIDEAVEESKNRLIVRSEDNLENVEYAINLFAQELNKNGLEINLTTSIEEKENIDWIEKYRASIEPIEVDKFYIRPTWCEQRDDLINIIIDPALAFGSGHHPTTSSCLGFISKYVKNNNTLIDVGCGSGILSIAANKLGAVVDICDTDELAIENSIKNFEFNNANINKSWVGSSNKADTKYDVVVANIVADVLMMIAKDLKKCMNDESILILSGILTTYKDRVLEKFKDLEVVDIYSGEEWTSIVLKKS